MIDAPARDRGFRRFAGLRRGWLRRDRWLVVGALAGAVAFVAGFGIGGSRDRPAAVETAAPSVIPTTIITSTTVPPTTTTTVVGNLVAEGAPTRLVAVTEDGQSLVAIDPRRGDSTLLDRVSEYWADGVVRFGRISISPDGAWVYYAALREVSDSGSDGFTLAVPTSGTGAPRQVAEGVSPAVSPAGTHLATIRSPGVALLITDLEATASKTRKPLRWRESGRIDHPAWSPDGRMLVFEHWQGSQSDLWVVDTDENGPLDKDSTKLRSADRAWSRPVWVDDGDGSVLYAIERCCAPDQFQSATRMVSLDPAEVRPSLLQSPAGEVAEIFVDTSGTYLLLVNGDGQLSWLGPDETSGVLAVAGAMPDRAPAFSTADW